jgi:hypothetical protein
MGTSRCIAGFTFDRVYRKLTVTDVTQAETLRPGEAGTPA